LTEQRTVVLSLRAYHLVTQPLLVVSRYDRTDT